MLDLDATAVLSAAEDLTREQREREVDVLRLVLQWADLHADGPGEGRVLGSDQLIDFGGEGTPPVRELCWAELAIARQCALVSIKHLAADALDLRHRLPLVWQAVQDLRLPAWVARKVAAMSRQLAKADVVIVDVAVAAAADQAPGRILAIAEAKVIEADPGAPGLGWPRTRRRSVCGSLTRDQVMPSTRPTENPRPAGSRSSCRPAPRWGSTPR